VHEKSAGRKVLRCKDWRFSGVESETMNDEIKISEAARAAGIEINALVETYRGRALESAEQIMRIVQRFSDDRVKELEPRP